MQTKLLVILLCAVLACSATANLMKEEIYEQQFTNFMRDYKKGYTINTFFNRYRIFKSNLDKIHIHNSRSNATWTMAMNEFGDLTAEEFFSTHLGYKKSLRKTPLPKYTDHDNPMYKVDLSRVPASVDWRLNGAVTPIINQGNCGSCWSFGATGGMESAWAIAKGQLLSLSEQQLVDCSGEGCSGGLPQDAFTYVIQVNGITSETSYPYLAQDGTCKTPLPSPVVAISSYQDIVNSDSMMQARLANGPLTVSIEADKMAFQFYSTGVFNNANCGTSLDHSVLLVGYETSATAGNYWILKNSWGTSWGVQGYMYIARKTGSGICGVNMDTSYPIV